MRIKINFILILLAIQSFSQSDSLKSVLLVPFHEDIYYNMVAEKLCLETRKSYPQIANILRLNLDSIITTEVSKNNEAFSLLRSFTNQSNSIIENLYNSASYKHKTAPDFDYKKFERLKKSKIALNKRQEKKAKQGINKGELTAPVIDTYDKYLNVSFKNNSILVKVLDDNKSHGLVFISQLEIISDYSVSESTSKKGFDVFFKVHYNIFAKDGKHSFGSVAIIQIPVEEITMQSITNIIFPELAKIITKNIIIYI